MEEIANPETDIVHYLWTLTTDGKSVLCPKDEKANRVLDVGTGTGIWAIEFGMHHETRKQPRMREMERGTTADRSHLSTADLHPDAEVIGVDLSPIQPTL